MWGQVSIGAHVSTSRDTSACCLGPTTCLTCGAGLQVRSSARQVGQPVPPSWQLWPLSHLHHLHVVSGHFHVPVDLRQRPIGGGGTKMRSLVLVPLGQVHELPRGRMGLHLRDLSLAKIMQQGQPQRWRQASEPSYGTRSAPTMRSRPPTRPPARPPAMATQSMPPRSSCSCMLAAVLPGWYSAAGKGAG